MNRFFEPIVTLFKNIFRIKSDYVAEVVCYLDENDNEVMNQITNKTKIIDAFVIEDYSRTHAYQIAFQVINFKYSGKGYDIVIYDKKKYVFENKNKQL